MRGTWFRNLHFVYLLPTQRFKKIAPPESPSRGLAIAVENTKVSRLRPVDPRIPVGSAGSRRDPGRGDAPQADFCQPMPPFLTIYADGVPRGLTYTRHPNKVAMGGVRGAD